MRPRDSVPLIVAIPWMMEMATDGHYKYSILVIVN